MAQIQTFEFDIQQFNPNNPYGSDEKIPVEFYMGVEQDQAATLEAGRPIFKDIECIRIFNSKDNIIDRPVRQTDLKRWPQKYQAWKLTGISTAGSVGTPLEHWPPLTKSQVEEFKYFKIYTVEQLADMPDSQGTPIPGFQKYKAQARATLEIAKGEAPIMRMQAQLEERDNKIAAMQDQMDKMNKKLEQLTAAKTK